MRQNLQRGAASAPLQLGGALVSTNLFDLLGVRATAGRTFDANDGWLREAPPIVISERLLRSGIVSGSIGDLLQLDGASYRLVGIMPEGFWFPDWQTNYWLPFPTLPMSATDAPAVTRSFPVIARLAPGVSRVAAEAQANARLHAGRQQVRVESYAAILSAPVRPALIVLQAASGLVLLLVCLNVGWLFVARARRLLPAFSTMRQLGASSGIVLVAHLVSAVFVAIIAVPAAILIAWLLLRYGMTLESGIFSRTAMPAVTAQVMIVSCLVTMLASVIACLPGALAVRWQARGRRFDAMAMIAQVGLVFAAGAQAVLVALVLWSLGRTNVGLTKTDYVVASIGVRGGVNFDPNVQLTRYKLLLDRLEHRGLRVAAANIFPLTDSDSTFIFEPRRSRDQVRTPVRTRIVTPSYFQITGLILTSGRLPTHADAGANRIVVTDAFAAAILQRQRQHTLDARTGVRSEFTIVGTAPPVRQFSITEEAQPEAYVLYDDYVATQSSAAMQLQHIALLAETGADAAATIRTIRDEVAALLPEVEIQSASHVRDLIDRSLGVNRLVAAGSIVFAAVAILLAALGLYAMVAHGLERRRREIGILMALGATSARVAMEAVRPIGVVYAAGVCLGSLLLLSTRSAIQSVMVPPPGVGYPPLVMVAGTAAALLLVVLLVACYRPVKSAAGSDPAVSLRID